LKSAEIEPRIDSHPARGGVVIGALRQVVWRGWEETMIERITLDELEAKMADPDTRPEELRPYLLRDDDNSKPLAPAFRPNPETVEIPEDDFLAGFAGDWANGLARRQRRRAFERAGVGDPRPILVSEGDSWFQFPFFLEDTIDKLSGNYRIWSADAAGDTLQNMVFDKPEYAQALDAQRDRFKAFLLSGAGNDIVGDDGAGSSVLEKIVLAFSPDQAEAKFYITNDHFEEKLAFVEKAYRTVLDHMKENFPDRPVLLHGYDYALPGGYEGDARKPFYAEPNQWMGRYLGGEKLGFKDHLFQAKIIRAMIDRLNEVQIKLCGGNHQGGVYPNAYHVDIRGLLPRDADWNDELHPTNASFLKVAQRFHDTLKGALANH
jgi:hypothetical protein